MARRSDHTRTELKEMALNAAREIVREDGVSALSTRKLAKRIGYTSGTIYQIFKNRDDLGDQLNTDTVARLFEHCKDIPIEQPVHRRLRDLAFGFVDFANAHPAEWDAVINYPFSQNYESSPDYKELIGRLMGLICLCTDELYEPGQEDQQLSDARLLWHSLYGIFALATAGRINNDITVSEMVEDLVQLFLDARAN